ncbi:MAG: uroporphyrinogen-III synthase, partial [Terriglobales bacterium]
PAVFNSDGVLAALRTHAMPECRVLLPGAEGGRDQISQALLRRGAIVTSVAAYRTEAAPGSEALARALFPGADAALFTSPSTARNLASLLGEDYRSRLREVVLAAIGPVTRRALEALGLAAAVEAAEASDQGLAAALANYFHARTA